MARLYTRTGDAGETALIGGERVAKSHRRVAAYGEVDELNSAIGFALTQMCDGASAERLARTQHDLFAIGARLATPPGEAGDRAAPAVPAERVAEMEAWIDEAGTELEPLREFILPGGSPGAAALHVARTVCRRAERAVVALHAAEPVDPEVLRYLNRLSDLLFVLARVENRRAGRADVTWSKDA